MKNLVLIYLFTVLAGFTLAQHGHSIAKDAKHVTTCPITGDKVDIDVATKKKLFADYKGNRYYFCCDSCPAVFKASPEKYAKKPHVKTPASTTGGTQKVSILVDGSFRPSTVRVRAGKPVQITFDTKRRSCASSVIFDGLNLKKPLQNGKKTVVNFTPKKRGTYTFHCPMNMIKGKLIVR